MGNSSTKSEKIRSVNIAYIKCVKLCNEIDNDEYNVIVADKDYLGINEEIVEKERKKCKDSCLKGKLILNEEILKKWSFK